MSLKKLSKLRYIVPYCFSMSVGHSSSRIYILFDPDGYKHVLPVILDML